MTGFPFLLLALGMSCVCYAFKLRIFLSDLSAYRVPSRRPRGVATTGSREGGGDCRTTLFEGGLKFLNVYGCNAFSLGFFLSLSFVEPDSK